MRFLTKSSKVLARTAIFLCLWAPVRVFAAGATGESIVFVADSRRYSGPMAWFTNLYNESLAQFALLTVVLVPVLALVLSTIMGFLLSRTGIDLKSRAVAGH